MDKIEVQEFGLFQFMVKIQDLFEEGYRLDFSKNENVPMSYGTMFVANMFKKQPEVVAEVSPEVTEDVVVEEVTTEATVVEPEVTVEVESEESKPKGKRASSK